MTVVRNEFERSENSSARVLYQQVRSAALPWHNYGRAVIGNRADIERVPISNLKAFYQRHYQPDNAVLVITGKFDPAQAFRLVADAFGKLPRPQRVLGETFTAEPTQDGERSISVRRVGGSPELYAVWRIPASSDPDYPALMVLQGVLGDQPQGRLHQALVDGKKAASARCDLDEFKEPGLFGCTAMFKEGDATAPAREAMLALLEAPKGLTEAEVARSRDGWLSQWEQQLASADFLGFLLSEYAGRGDWRLLYLQRDRLREVKVADVERVWARYLKAQNRTLGEYVPTAKPDRAEVPPAADARKLLAGYTGGAAVQQGEAFDPSPANIEARARRSQLANGAKLVLLPKRTRAQTVKLSLDLRLGTAETLQGQQAVATLSAALLGRGTRRLPYKDFRSALERLKSQLDVSGSGQHLEVSISTQRPQLAEVLTLLKEVLETPALDGQELEVLKGELVARLDSLKAEPQALGGVELARALQPLPPGHIDAILPLAEQAVALKAVTLEQVKAFHQRFHGARYGAIAVVGDFEPAEVEKALAASLGAWTAPEAYLEAPHAFVATQPTVKVLPTPDKANAWMGAGAAVQLLDTAPDYPALLLAAEVLGGGPSARLFSVLRDRQGLTYGAYAALHAQATRDTAVLTSTVIYAPQNAAAVESGLLGELARWPTITSGELDGLRTELLQQRYQARANDEELAGMLAELASEGRTLAWEASLDAALRGVTADQANAAVRSHIDPARLVLVKAGDFKPVAGPR
jgi:zinc protease